jgi:hypothetical protein
MPIFISYSHTDSEFVDRLAAQLVKNRAYVWIDRWELKVGDSITMRIQEAIEEASALLVVLSDASVNLPWCQKELSAGLIRELDEKRVVVLPLLLSDCKRPVFLRDKVYADFREDFDSGLHATLAAIAAVTSESLGRTVTPSFHHDWGLDWGELDGRICVNVTAATLPGNQPLTVLTSVRILLNETLSDRYRAFADQGFDWFARQSALAACTENVDVEKFRILIDDSFPKIREFTLRDPKLDWEYELTISCRRLGEDTGNDLLYDVHDLLVKVRDQLVSQTRKLDPAEMRRLMAIVNVR